MEYELEIPIILTAECGDAFELWEPVEKMMAYCLTCNEYHTYWAE